MRTTKAEQDNTQYLKVNVGFFFFFYMAMDLNQCEAVAVEFVQFGESAASGALTNLTAAHCEDSLAFVSTSCANK
jgi:hypothetical protein